jgi:hypothetical protein
MPNTKIDEFAAILVKQVRDAAIRGCDRKLRQDARGPVAKRWRQLSRDANLEAVANTLIPDIVDETVFQLLRAVDQGILKLSFTASNAEKIELDEDGFGELGGWYMGVPGWRSTYSEERLIDDFSSLR